MEKKTNYLKLMLKIIAKSEFFNMIYIQLNALRFIENQNFHSYLWKFFGSNGVSGLEKKLIIRYLKQWNLLIKPY